MINVDDDYYEPVDDWWSFNENPNAIDTLDAGADEDVEDSYLDDTVNFATLDQEGFVSDLVRTILMSFTPLQVESADEFLSTYSMKTFINDAKQIRVSVDKLTIGDGAIIDGNLEYSSKTAEALELDGNAIINGTTTFKEISGLQVDTAKAKNFLFAALSAFLIFKLLALIITALILAWLFKGFSNSVAKGAIQNPLRFLGKGFVALIITPIASILLFITLFGIPIGLITLLSYILVLLLSCIYTGALVGVWVSQLISKSDKAVITWKNILGGVILLAIVTTIPFIGWIIGFLVFLLTLGSITDIILKKLWTDR